MKDLPKYFPGKGQVKGYSFNQISATPYGHIYAKTSAEGSKTFEVFKRLENDVYDCVSYPTDKAFGKWAWNTGSLERAQNILNKITEEEESKKAKELASSQKKKNQQIMIGKSNYTPQTVSNL